ncbi:MAG: hypothetical protein HZA36_01680 [Parcubacteria group bacterium]|nr:hypothetical protein [Parcubacteria group bacterium]
MLHVTSKISLTILLANVLLLYSPSQIAFAKDQDTSSLERKIQVLKETKKEEAPANQTLKLKKGILYDLFDLVIEEDEKLGSQLVESHLSTSTQEIFLTALWDDEQWYFTKRLETSKATSTDAITRITKNIKKHRQEVQDILQKQISGMILVGDAEYTLIVAEKRLSEIKDEIKNIPPEEKKNVLLDNYLTKIQDQLEETHIMIQETRDIFENLKNKKEYEMGVKNISNASELIKLMYEEFIAMGRLTGNPLLPQDKQDTSDKT